MVTMTKKGCDTFAHFGAFCHCVGGEYNHHEKMNILCWKLRKMHTLPKDQKFLYMDWQCSQSWHVVGNPVAHCIVNTSISGITLLCMCVFHHLYLNIFCLPFCLLWCVFVHWTGVFVHCKGVFVHYTGVFVHCTGIFVHSTVYLCIWSPLQ